MKTEASLCRESVLLPAAMGDGVNSWVGGCGNPALVQENPDARSRAFSIWSSRGNTQIFSHPQV